MHAQQNLFQTLPEEGLRVLFISASKKPSATEVVEADLIIETDRVNISLSREDERRVLCPYIDVLTLLDAEGRVDTQKWQDALTEAHLYRHKRECATDLFNVLRSEPSLDEQYAA